MSDATGPEQVARKIVVRAIKAPCVQCNRPLPPDKLHWSPLTDSYLCYICSAGRRRGPTLRETLQRITKPASGSQAAAS